MNLRKRIGGAVPMVAMAVLAALPARAAEPLDLSTWERVLAAHVAPDTGRVDYDGLKRDRSGLDRFVDALAHAGPRTQPELYAGRERKFCWSCSTALPGARAASCETRRKSVTSARRKR